MKKTLAILATFSLLFALIGCRGQQQADTASPSGAGQELDSTEYKFVPPSELEFTIEDFNYEAMVGKGGTAVPIGGNIGKLLCNGKEIELANTEFEDGFIVTKDFGRIQVLFSSSLTRTGMEIRLTDKQKKDLVDFATK